MTISLGAKKKVAAPAKKAAPAKVAAPVKKAAPKVVATAKVAAPAKKVVAPAKKAAAPAKKVAAPAKKAAVVGSRGPSEALPFASTPANLDGSLTGDAGFDPVGISLVDPGVNSFFDGFGDKLKWYREAEIMHGRIAQIAVLGFIWPGVFGTLPANEWVGLDAFSYTNPVEALDKAPHFAIEQIFTFMSILELRRITLIQKEGDSYVPGDFKLGQGEGRYNPFGFNYTPEEYEEKKLQEIKHGRLAMLGAFGLWAQASNSGLGIADQLGAALSSPGYYAKAGYFFPEGI